MSGLGGWSIHIPIHEKYSAARRYAQPVLMAVPVMNFAQFRDALLNISCLGLYARSLDAEQGVHFR